MALPQLRFALPFVGALLQKSLIAVLVGFTPAGSALRIGLFPIAIYCNYYLLPFYAAYITPTVGRTFAAGYSLCALLEYLEKVLLSQWSYDDYGPRAELETRRQSKDEEGNKWIIEKSPGQGKEGRRKSLAWDRLKFGTWVAFSFRYIASPYQGRKVPPYDASNPSYIPTRAAFLRNNAITFGYCYLIMDLLSQGNQPDMNQINFSEKKIPFFSRLNEVTAEEFVTRIMTIILYWGAGYFFVKGLYAGLNFLSVATGCDNPELSRPFNGPLSGTYTLRGFWGTFWHQNIRKMCTKPARYITFNVLQLPRTKSAPNLPVRLLSRYTELTLVFLVSGLLHLYVDMAQGIPWRDNGAIRGFLMMVLGIMIEDSIQSAFRTLTGQKEIGGVWARAVGYSWVILWLSWATPVWAYPTLRGNGGAASESLPLSVFGLVREMRAGDMQSYGLASWVH